MWLVMIYQPGLERNVFSWFYVYAFGIWKSSHECTNAFLFFFNLLTSFLNLTLYFKSHYSWLLILDSFLATHAGKFFYFFSIY